MHHMKHMVGCLMLIGAIVVIGFVGDGVPGWVVGLVLLACPATMIWMVVMMSREGGTRARGEAASDRYGDDHAHH
jgi:peptidoglycan/LPS O-acetylase OafA/YrhL